MSVQLQTMTDDEYDALEGIRWSTLREMRISPRHYHHRAAHERDDTAAFRLGRAVHCALLEPERFVRDWVMYDLTKQRRGKVWDAFKADADELGQEVLNAPEWANCIAMSEAVRDEETNVFAPELLAMAQHVEVVVQWQDDTTRLPCKARLDLITSDGIKVELKTTRNIEARWFGHDAARFGYHAQDAFHSTPLKGYGINVHRHVIIAVESEPPFDVVVHDVGADAIEVGRQMCNDLLIKVHKCNESGRWPGVASMAAVPLVLPPWAYGDNTPAEMTIGGQEVSV